MENQKLELKLKRKDDELVKNKAELKIVKKTTINQQKLKINRRSQAQRISYEQWESE